MYIPDHIDGLDDAADDNARTIGHVIDASHAEMNVAAVGSGQHNNVTLAIVDELEKPRRSVDRAH